MTLQEIYFQFTPGSPGFVKAVQIHCGFDLSTDEILRLAEVCPRPKDFRDTWENEDWWKDSRHQAATAAGLFESL